MTMTMRLVTVGPGMERTVMRRAEGLTKEGRRSRQRPQTVRRTLAVPHLTPSVRLSPHKAVSAHCSL